MAQPLVLIAGGGIGGLAPGYRWPQYAVHRGQLQLLLYHKVLAVDTVLAVHGQQPVPLAEVVSAIERQVRNTQPRDVQFFQPGCPVHYNRPLQASSD
jgi:hypothetical protein